MDPVRFDTLVKSLSTPGTRRRLLRASIGASLSGLWLAGPAPTVAATCRRPGEDCHRSSQCCSGLCRKDRKTCAPLPTNAQGCTIDDASCKSNAAPGTGTPCPKLPDGFSGVCRKTLNGRPVCAVGSTIECENCQDNQQCVDKFGFGVGAICVRCKSCASGTTCICPFFVKGGEG